jgi:hypothetical protein
MTKQAFRARFDELPVIGDFVGASFERDQNLFADFSPVYEGKFAENYRDKLKTVKSILMSDIVTAKRMLVTKKLHEAQDELITMTESINRYCEMAKLHYGPKNKDLDLVKLRKNLRARNCVASISGASIMLQLLEQNLGALEEKGFTPARQQKLRELIETIEKLDVRQNDLLNDRKFLVDDNLRQLNDFWAMIRDIMQTGQIIHRNNPTRKAEYTEKNLMSRVRFMTRSKQTDDAQKSVKAAEEESKN